MNQASNKSLLPQVYQTKLMLELEDILTDFKDLDIKTIKNFWNPIKCREDLLPYLAKYLGVVYWDSSWPITDKRSVCLNALVVNKQKGTIKSLKEALKAINLNAEIIEWWMNSRPKGTAEIVFDQESTIGSLDDYKNIISILNEVKRLSLHIQMNSSYVVKKSIFLNAGLIETRKSNITQSKQAFSLNSNSYIAKYIIIKNKVSI